MGRLRCGVVSAVVRNNVTLGGQLGETNLTVTIEGCQRFPVRVRYAPQFRTSPDALGQLLVPAPNGDHVVPFQRASPSALATTTRTPRGSHPVATATVLGATALPLAGAVVLGVPGIAAEVERPGLTWNTPVVGGIALVFLAGRALLTGRHESEPHVKSRAT